MNFKLRQIKGESRKKRKEWRSGVYRIVWRNEAFGVKVPPGFFANIRVDNQWLSVDRHGTYKTFAAAERACIKHEGQ